MLLLGELNEVGRRTMREQNYNFTKNFRSYIMIVIIPFIIVGFLTIEILFGSLANDTKRLNYDKIEQCASNLDNEINKMHAIFYQIESDYKINTVLSGYLYNKSIDKYDLYDMTKELNILRGQSDVVVNTGIFFTETKEIITNTSVCTLEDFYNVYINTEKYTLGMLEDLFNNGRKSNRYITYQNTADEKYIICYKKMNVMENLDDFIVFAVLNNNNLFSKINLDDEKIGFEFSIIDFDDNIIANSEGFDTNYKESSKIKEDEIEVIPSEAIGGNYVFYLTKGSMSGNVRQIMIIFTLLIILAILISILLAFFNWKKTKKIFMSVFNENAELEGNLAQHRESAKERILQNLLYDVQIGENKCLATLKNYDINFTKKFFVVMTVSSPGNFDSEFSSQIEEKAWDELNTILLNNIKECGITCEVVKTGNLIYSYILNYNEKDLPGKLKGRLLELMKREEVTINFGVGDEVDDIENLYTSYENSVSALRFGISKRAGDFILYNEIQSYEDTKIYYTSDREKQLIRCIKMGLSDEVEVILNEIYKVNFLQRQISYDKLKRLIYSISLSVYDVLDEIDENDSERHKKYNRVCKNIFRNDDVEESFAIIKEICLYLCDTKRKRNDKTSIKDQLIEFIENNYSDNQLTLEKTADHFKISYYYLSRMFKEQIGTNFVSYITNLRLEKAIQYLKNTEESIEKIALMVGFTDGNSFARSFKKNYNSTPGSYRKNMKEK